MVTLAEHATSMVDALSARTPSPIANPLRRGPVVLATDGTSRGGAPVVAARLLAARLDVPLEVVSVLEPPPFHTATADYGMLGDPAIDEMRREGLETAVSDYVGRFSGGAAPPRIRVRSGAVGPEIARFAHEVSATIIVVGSAPHRRLRRVVSGELAVSVLRTANCPVLSVPPGFTALPRAVVAAVDFGPSSVRAAQAALLVIDDHGTLVLTHVVPPLMTPAALSTPRQGDSDADMPALFHRLREELAPSVPTGVKLETRLITDDAVDGILTSADHVEAQLIAVGTHGPGLFARLFVGSVTSSLLHDAEPAVLASPPPPAAEALELWHRVSGGALAL